MTVCKFHERTLPEHTPIERTFKRIDESFVLVGHFVRFDPLDTEPRFIDPPHKRPEKNRAQRRAEMASQRIVSGVLVPRGRSDQQRRERIARERAVRHSRIAHRKRKAAA